MSPPPRKKRKINHNQLSETLIDSSVQYHTNPPIEHEFRERKEAERSPKSKSTFTVTANDNETPIFLPNTMIIPQQPPQQQNAQISSPIVSVLTSEELSSLESNNTQQIMKQIEEDLPSNLETNLSNKNRHNVNAFHRPPPFSSSSSTTPTSPSSKLPCTITSSNVPVTISRPSTTHDHRNNSFTIFSSANMSSVSNDLHHNPLLRQQQNHVHNRQQQQHQFRQTKRIINQMAPRKLKIQQNKSITFYQQVSLCFHIILLFGPFTNWGYPNFELKKSKKFFFFSQFIFVFELNFWLPSVPIFFLFFFQRKSTLKEKNVFSLCCNYFLFLLEFLTNQSF